MSTIIGHARYEETSHQLPLPVRLAPWIIPARHEASQARAETSRLPAAGMGGVSAFGRAGVPIVGCRLTPRRRCTY